MNKRIWGIILIVFDVMAILGSFANGSFARYAQEMTLSNLVTVLLMIGMMVGGIILIIKGKK